MDDVGDPLCCVADVPRPTVPRPQRARIQWRGRARIATAQAMGPVVSGGTRVLPVRARQFAIAGCENSEKTGEENSQ
jgi:hypothetical protein